MVRPVDNLIIGADLLGSFQPPLRVPGLLSAQPVPPTATAVPATVVAQPVVPTPALPATPAPAATPAAQAYDDAIMRNARGIGLLGQTPTSSAV